MLEAESSDPRLSPSWKECPASPEVQLPQCSEAHQASEAKGSANLLQHLSSALLPALVDQVKGAAGMTGACIAHTAQAVRLATPYVVATLERSSSLGTAAANVATDMTHETLHKMGALTTSTVSRASEMASSSVTIVRDGAESARQQVQQYLKEGWVPGAGALLMAGRASPVARVLSQGSVGDEYEYENLLQFERAAEICISAGRMERLPFVLRSGHTVCWEFRVKDLDIRFALAERRQGYGGATEVPLVGPERVKAGVCVRGSYTSEDEKSIVMIWDNSTSLFRSKNIAFLVRVLRPEGSTEEIIVTPRSVEASVSPRDTPTSPTPDTNSSEPPSAAETTSHSGTVELELDNAERVFKRLGTRMISETQESEDNDGPRRTTDLLEDDTMDDKRGVDDVVVEGKQIEKIPATDATPNDLQEPVEEASE